jgi:hypothetical protein
MKTIKISISIICILLIQSVCQELSAQNILDSLREECSVTGYVRKILTNHAYVISIENNESLLNRFIETFEIERNNALYTAQKKDEHGKIISEIHVFNEKEGDNFISYAYDITDNKNARITYSKSNAYELISLFDNVKDRLNREGMEKFDTKPVSADFDMINMLNKNVKMPSDTANILHKTGISGSPNKSGTIHFHIPKNGYIIVNGEKLTAKQAREKGLDVEEF